MNYKNINTYLGVAEFLVFEKGNKMDNEMEYFNLKKCNDSYSWAQNYIPYPDQYDPWKEVWRVYLGLFVNSHNILVEM